MSTDKKSLPNPIATPSASGVEAGQGAAGAAGAAGAREDQVETHGTTIWGWIGYGLPNRECAGTYDVYEYDTLEPIQVDPRFQTILTVGDLLTEAHAKLVAKLIPSPTACSFEIDHSTNIFYRDSQDCVRWAHDPQTGHVYIHEYKPGTKRMCVAKSLPEFLTRIHSEAQQWFAAYAPSLRVFS